MLLYPVGYWFSRGFTVMGIQPDRCSPHLHGERQVDGIAARLVVDAERVAVAIDEVEPLADIAQPHAPLHILLAVGLRILAEEVDLLAHRLHHDADMGVVAVAHPVLEGVLHKHHKQQRGHLATHLRLHVDVEVDALGEAEAHQCDVVGQKLHLARHRNGVAVALIDHIAHHP